MPESKFIPDYKLDWKTKVREEQPANEGRRKEGGGQESLTHGVTG